MTRILHELHGRDGHRFSPYCWRAIMALKHKGLLTARQPTQCPVDEGVLGQNGARREYW